MSGPAVSVLIVVWNAERSLRRAVDSVLAERDIDLECVVVDDGSTDETPRILAEIAAADPRVIAVPMAANAGVSAARNRGLEVVRGEWLTLLDADDRFRPGGLSELHRAAVTREAGAVVGQQVWSNGRRTWISGLYDRSDIRRPGRKSLVAAPGLVYYASPHGKLFRRSSIAGLTFEGRVLGDQPWVIAALLRAGDGIEVIGDVVYEWIRTAPAGAGPSITTATRASTQHGIDAAGVATGALTRVIAEASTAIADPDGRRIVAAAYVDRLLRSDLGAHLGRALDRGDPTMGELFTAIADFIDAAPAGLLADASRLDADGDSLARDIVAPPLMRWHRVPEPARAAYRRLAAAAVAAQPDLIRHGRNRLDRWALRVALWESGGLRFRIALAALRVSRATSLLSRGFGGLRRRIRPRTRS